MRVKLRLDLRRTADRAAMRAYLDALDDGRHVPVIGGVVEMAGREDEAPLPGAPSDPDPVAAPSPAPERPRIPDEFRAEAVLQYQEAVRDWNKVREINLTQSTTEKPGIAPSTPSVEPAPEAPNLHLNPSLSAPEAGSSHGEVIHDTSPPPDEPEAFVWTPEDDLRLVEGAISGKFQHAAKGIGVPLKEALARWHEIMPKKGVSYQERLLKKLRAQVAA